MPDIHTLKALAVESHPPTAIPPGGIRPVVNEKLAEIERGRNNLLSATEKMMREYCHPLDERSFSMKGMIDSIPISFTLDQMLTDVGLTLPGGEA